MMTSVHVKKTDAALGSFFEFASGRPMFCFRDILNDLEANDPETVWQSPGVFLYNTEFLVDQDSAHQQGVVGVKFLFFKKDPLQYELYESDGIAVAEVIFPTHDLTSKTVSHQPGQLASISINTFNNSEQKILMATKTDGSMPDEMLIPNTENAPPQPGFEVVSHSEWVNARDPAELAAQGNFATIGLTSAMGLSAYSDSALHDNYSLSVNASHGDVPPVRFSLTNLRHNLRKQRQGKQDNIMTQQYAATQFIGNKQSGGAAITLVPTKRPMSHDFFLPKAPTMGGDHIYVQIVPLMKISDQATDSDKKYRLSSKRETIVIDHRQQVFMWVLNPEPPNISIVYVNHRRAKIRIERTDPTLQSCHVLRIRKHPSMLKDEVTELGLYNFNSEGVITIDEIISNVKPNQFIYRVSACNHDGSTGEFSSIVLPSFKKISDPISSTTVPLSILAINSNNEISINVVTLSDKILSLRLLRQEIGKDGEFSQTVTHITKAPREYETIVDGKEKYTIRFSDKSAIHGRKYRYFCAYRTGTRKQTPAMSQELISDEDEVIICRKSATRRLPVELSINPPHISQGNSGNSVNFRIATRETGELFTTVKKALQAAGISESFLAELQKDDIKPKQFIMLLVERWNAHTGRKFSFGLQPASDFSDNAVTQQLTGAPPLEPGGKYSYIFKVCLQDPAIFLQTTNVGLINKHGKEIKKKAARFLRQIYTRMGVLPSESDIKNGVPMEQLILESQLGYEFAFDVKLQSAMGKLENIVIDEYIDFNLLKWSVSGQSKDISYFLVYCTLEGEKNLLGAVSACKSINSYTFKDTRYHKDVGTKSYRVQPVSYKDKLLGVSPSVTQQKMFSIPENMIVGAVFASFGKKSKIIPVAPGRGGHAKIMPPLEHPSGGGDPTAAMAEHFERLLKKPTPSISLPVFSQQNVGPVFTAASLGQGPVNVTSGPPGIPPMTNTPNFAGDALTSPQQNLGLGAVAGFENIGNNTNASPGSVNALIAGPNKASPSASGALIKSLTVKIKLNMKNNENYSEPEAAASGADNSDPPIGWGFGFKDLF